MAEPNAPASTVAEEPGTPVELANEVLAEIIDGGEVIDEDMKALLANLRRGRRQIKGIQGSNGRSN